ncbi:hypothetical protein KM043_018039 [Ampulex compressa]|nr:hypothetical protein KM043_018039 [Ampulex compressa]
MTENYYTRMGHSTMQNIMQAIQACNAIRYTSYRTAAKMQILHKELKMQHVHLPLIAGVFERHRLSITENCVNLDPSEVEDVLSDIYFAARKEASSDFNVELTTKLAMHYILNTFDKQCTGNVLVFSMKVALILISSSRLQEKYGYFYQQLADHNACLSRAGLHTLLTNICKITEMLGENTVYGYQHIQSHIDSCFAQSQGCLGVTESEFAAWVMQDPPLLVWITTFNRMKTAECVIHNIRCSSCKATPVRGPRYSCLKCTGYHQCQDCFLYGRTSNKHKVKHPVREYCVKTSNREVTKLIIELIRNKLRICPTRTVMIGTEDPVLETNCNETKHLDCGSLRSTVRRRVCNDPQKELQSIITHLEEENRQLQIELRDIHGTKAERLNRHRTTIESQLQRLKVLKKCLFTDGIQSAQVINRIQSTPMLQPLSSRLTALPLEFELSPIIRQDNSDQQISNLNNGKDALTSNDFNSILSTEHVIQDRLNSLECTGEASTSSGFGNALEPTRIELSTWIGGTPRLELNPPDSGFSQWLGTIDTSKNDDKYETKPNAPTTR